MIFRSIILTALLVGFSAAGEIQKPSGLRSLQGNGNGRKMTKPCTLVLRLEQFKDQTEAHKWDCELDNADSGTIVSFEKDRTFRRDQFDSGISTLFGDVTIFPNGKATIKGNPRFGRRKSNNNNDADRHLAVLGEKTVLAIRVQGNDTATTSDETKIADEIFGSGDDVFNLATGFSQCSSGALNFIPATQHTSVGSDGVYTVVLNESIAGLTDSDLRTKVVNAANAELGSLSSQFDHVMLCLPNIAGFGGIAYAYVNHWLSVYKDAWCNYPSAQLHEIGHNIGLAHSGESAAYDDQTGMMGYSYSQDEGPRMCFNNAKNWQLGWYTDRRATVTPLVSSSWTGNLVGVAQYNSTLDGQFVILKVEGGSLDYYVGFNRATGINSGTVEARNQVTIQSRALGTGYATSTLVAKLSADGTYSISNFGGSGDEVVIKVVSIDIASLTGFATVQVYKVGVETKAPTKTPTKSPIVTSSPTKAPTKNPTKAPTKNPTKAPIVTSSPTKAPTKNPTKAPTKNPTKAPIVTSSPTKAPTNPTKAPTKNPTKAPTTDPGCSSIFSNRTCKRNPDCAWVGGRCIVNNSTPTAPTPTAPTPTAPTPTAPTGNCSSYTGKAACANNGCKWNNKNKICQDV